MDLGTNFHSDEVNMGLLRLQSLLESHIPLKIENNYIKKSVKLK